MEKQRINYFQVAPEAMKGMMEMEKYIHSCGLEETIIELVKFRVSQMNGCAYCLDMHAKDARSEGETEQRLYCISAWRETPFYTEKEKAALAWAEALTDLPHDEVSKELFDEVRKQFGEKEMVDLTTAIVAINGWNRFGVGFRSTPGTYESKKSKATVQ